ncbi:putative protein LAZY1 [Helianthus annuus]|nr:putative protein LAZY1 [Helianthus annuus]
MVVLEPEAMENELKLINDELEKVLEPEGKENAAVVCPLQDYLFGSVIELSETVTVKKEKEHRTSLGELFQRTKTVEEVTTGGKVNKTEKIKEKETEKSAVCLMKKILKGRTHYSSSKHSSADKRPRKILQMFHRKVHPEGVAVEPKSENHLKHATEGHFVQEHKNKNQMLFEDDKLFPMVDASKKGANCTISHMPSDCCMTDSDGNRECWINSDADCKHANKHPQSIRDEQNGPGTATEFTEPGTFSVPTFDIFGTGSVPVFTGFYPQIPVPYRYRTVPGIFGAGTGTHF